MPTNAVGRELLERVTTYAAGQGSFADIRHWLEERADEVGSSTHQSTRALASQLWIVVGEYDEKMLDDAAARGALREILRELRPADSSLRRIVARASGE